MISLAGRDILHSWGKFVFTGLGLGLLIGVTLIMAGVYRGMVDDGQALLDNSGADLWVVQQDTQGPYAESSSLADDAWRMVRSVPGVAEAANVTYFTMQVRRTATGQEVRAMVVGLAPATQAATAGWPPHLVAGRHVVRSHYEAVADVATGLALGEEITLRRHRYRVVGLTQRMVSSSGDPMVFIPLKDAQEAQFLKDNDAIWRQRARTASNPAFNRPGQQQVLDAVNASQASSTSVNAVLVRLAPGADAAAVADTIARAKRFTVFTRAQMQEVLVSKLIATSAKQIGMFLVIFGGGERSDCGLHHLHADDGQNPRNRRAQAHWHAQPHHRLDDLAAGPGPGVDWLCRGQNQRHLFSAHLSQIRAPAAPGQRGRAGGGAGHLRPGQRGGHPHCAAH